MAMASGGWLLGRGLGSPSRTAEISGQRLLDDVLQRIRRNYVDSLSSADLFDRAMRGMLEELGDPNTVYLDSARLARLTEATTGVYTGLGVRFDARDGWPMVLSAMFGTPAERAGLVSGDRITEIDGRSTSGWTDDETRAALRGEAGTIIRLEVQRPGQERRFTVRLVRGEIHRAAVRRTALMDGGVGYIDLKFFSDSTERELGRAVDSLQRAGMRSLVLDLRNNPGGLLTQGVAVSELFLDSAAVIVRMRGRGPSGDRTYHDMTAQRWPLLPMVVLVDRATASASEIVAGALQDHDRALLMGQATFGKGSAQAVFEAGRGGLKLTTARWFTPSGRSIDRARAEAPEGTGVARPTYKTDAGREVFGAGGITPDVEVAEPAPPPGELALQAQLGARVTEFRDALTTYATTAAVRAGVETPGFEVTPEILEGAWRAVRARGFVIDRATWDSASRLVASFVGREMVRIALGTAAEVRRSLGADSLVQAASARLRVVREPRDVFGGPSRVAERTP
jgi:carboxyl-terminal processing protease